MNGLLRNSIEKRNLGTKKGRQFLKCITLFQLEMFLKEEFLFFNYLCFIKCLMREKSTESMGEVFFYVSYEIL